MLAKIRERANAAGEKIRDFLGGIFPKIFRRKRKTFRRERGDAGEDFAAKFLRKSGMKILLRNFTHGKDEIDIVALDGKCLVFAEVKTRSERDLHGGLVAVDARKRNAQSRAVRAYLRALKPPAREHRFDVVEISVRESDGAMSAVHHRAIPLPARPRKNFRKR